MANSYKFGEIIVKPDASVYVVDINGNEVPIHNSGDLSLVQSNISQTLGDSPNLVISQKGITDAINAMYPTFLTSEYLIGDNTHTEFTIEHSFDTKYPFITILDTLANNEEVFAKIIYNDVSDEESPEGKLNSFTIKFDIIPATDRFKVVIRHIITREEAFRGI